MTELSRSAYAQVSKEAFSAAANAVGITPEMAPKLLDVAEQGVVQLTQSVVEKGRSVVIWGADGSSDCGALGPKPSNNRPVVSEAPLQICAK